MGFSRAELEAARQDVVDDLLGADLRLLVVGINPGLWTAAANAHFARPGNRFWPALHRAGADRLSRLVQRTRPRVVAVLGVTAYRRAFGRPKAVAGRQEEQLAGAELWVLPNPSGLNAHETVDSLAAAYRAAAQAAGVAMVLVG
ncbi:MAG TPA: mismatch-specific DNA-glycosylase [Dermatophilaceae bacterium]|nr:mismatch-specific DNA-glycosylase [Dermatophilaceae bacterium]